MKKNEQKQNRKRLNSQSALQKLPPLNKKQQAAEKPCLNQISHQDEGIVGLLYEYFIKNNFMDTLDSFQKDCYSKGFKPNNKFIQSFRHEIIEAFDQGNRQAFMARFAQFVPISMRNKDLQTMKLEFYTQVYFFVYSIHPQLGKKRAIDAAHKQAFISYLEGKGAALAKSQQFLQYYALAYLQKPQDHPTFKTIFTKQWISELKKQLTYFIEKLYPSGKVPVITSIYDKFLEKNMEKNNSEQSITQPDQQNQIEQQIQPQQSQVLQINPNQSSRAQQNPRYQSLRSPNNFQNTDRERQSMSLKIAQLQQQKNQLIKFIQNVKKKYQSLQNNYKDFTDVAQNTLMQSQSKWFKITQQFYNVASNLRDICVKMQNNQPLEDPNIIQKINIKLSKYESFVKMNIEDLISENVDFSLFERPDHDASVDMMRKNNDDRPQFYIQLDFDKIKQVLSNQTPQYNQNKCSLLEALRWRINRSRGTLVKRQIILSFVLNDIFNIKQGDQLLKSLLSPANEAVAFKTMQLLNSLTKDFYGRKYLACQTAVKNAMNLLYNQGIHQNIVVITVSFLQQMSVRKRPQQMMIQGEFIKWIVNKLRKQRQTMSEYLMQYSLATIINLLLKKEGLEKSEQIKEQILSTLIDLMQIEILEIREYVHGAIYPLFYKKVFRDKAKEYGLEANIKFLLENTQSEYLINQLNHLQKQLMREEDDDMKNQQNENDEQEDTDDIFEEEFGEDLQFQQNAEPIGGLEGQQLLMKMYPLTGPDAIKQLNTIRQQAEVTLKNKSVYVASNFSQRPSTNNRAIVRRNISNNNSVYSNKSSNRALKSQLMNRSQLNKNQGRDRLDTVHPDGSEKQMSIKDFIENLSQFDKQGQPSQKQSRQKQSNNFPQKAKKAHAGRGSEQNILENGSFNNNQAQSTKQQKPLKPYQATQQYMKVFMARKALVHTPPEK